MSLMATSGLLTRADLDALPDDGLRHELIDGTFVMTPAPGFRHQLMVVALAADLRSACADSEFTVLPAPFDVVLGPNVVQPDVVVAPRTAFNDRELPVAPVLAVEVRSPATGWLDEGRKRTIYEQHGVESYWLVDPLEPSITILELTAGRYVEVATVRGERSLEVRTPFPITLNPAALARG